MKSPLRYLLASVFAWCIFWWGYAVGMRTSADAEIAQAKADIQFGRRIRSSCGDDCPRSLLASIEELRANRLQLLRRSRASTADLLLSPITAPISALAFSQVHGDGTDE